MLRYITGYHLDEQGDWIADLNCFHGQHVRHNPPFTNRPWVTTEQGRASKIGMELKCLRCDRLEFPEGLATYKKTPQFTCVPAGFQKNHSTKPGVWGQVHVLQGGLTYVLSDSGINDDNAPREFVLKTGEYAAIAPEMKHRVENLADEPLCFYVEFYRR